MKTRSMTHPRRTPDGGGAQLARGLGWFSVALGLAELAAPRALARLIGLKDTARTRTALRAFGAREVASGLAILARPERPGPVWARVAGDALDLAAMGISLGDRRTDAPRMVAAIAAVVGVAALDVYAGLRLTRAADAARQPAVAVTTVRCAPEEAYAFWRQLERHSDFLVGVDEVRAVDARWSRWSVKTPAGDVVAWDTELVEDQPGARIAWRSREGADVEVYGEVRFHPAPGARGTEVRLELVFGEERARAAEAVAGLFAEPLLEESLRRFKQVMETGELARSDAGAHPGLHPARPSNELEEVTT